MKPPFGFVVLHGDGSRVTRFSVPRWIAYGALGLQTALLASVAAFSGAAGQVLQHMEALRTYAADRGAAVDTLERRIVALHEEIDAWKELHTKMWRAFAPDGTADVEPTLRDLKRVVSRTTRMVTALPLRWPVNGPVRSGYGLRASPWTGKPERHRGIDIGSPPGTPIRSPGAGTVVAMSSHGRLGNHVALDHGNGVKSLYGHLEAFDVKNGERVERGQVIGFVGNTGRSTGPHLHYELLVDGKPVDPRGFLPQR